MDLGTQAYWGRVEGFNLSKPGFLLRGYKETILFTIDPYSGSLN